MVEDAIRAPVKQRTAAPGLRFVITAAVLSITLFGVMRIPFVEQNLLLPFTKAQHGLACRIGGNPDAPIVVGLSCSAADVMALCLGFILAFPVSIRKRLTGAAIGLLLIAGVNTIRIATLSHAVKSRHWFDLLHVYLWPGVLLVVVSVFVFLWMNHSLASGKRRAGRRSLGALLSGTVGRFVVLTLLFVALFVGTSGWWMHSAAVKTVAIWVAAAGAGVIRLFGGEVTLVNNVLRTTNGAFMVTQECIMTPLIPAYFAATLALPMRPRSRILWLAAAFPVFFVLGAARLLVLAFPTQVVGSHLIAIHGFYQLLLAAFLIVLAAYLSPSNEHLGSRVARRAGLGLGVGALAFVVLMLSYNRLLLAATESVHALIGHSGHAYMDPQGALLWMAPYQIALLAALWLAWGAGAEVRRGLIALAALMLTQPVVLVLLGEWVAHTALAPHVAVLRAATVLLTLIAWVWSVDALSVWRARGSSRAPEVPRG